MKIIIGVGNPGAKYAKTRHNVGFLVIDLLAERFKCSLKDRKKTFKSVRIAADDAEIVLAKPALFMNESGTAVKDVVDHFNVTADSCLILVDDVNLPIGKIRFRPQGSSGGHNGLQSIASALGTEAFPRLRIGIGPYDGPGELLPEYVLSKFSSEGLKKLQNPLERAKDACLEWTRSAPEEIMQKFN